MYANTGTNARTFTFYLQSTVTAATSIFTFTWVIFCRTTFTFTVYLSKNNLKYLYF